MLYAGVLLVLILQFLRPQEFLAGMTGDPVVFYTMLLLLPPWLFTLVKKKLLRTPVDFFLFLFYITCITSYWHWDKSAFLEPAEHFGKVFLIYLFVTHVVDTRGRITGAISMIMLTLVVVALMAAPVTEGPETGTYANVGAFKDRNDFGAAMATIIPFAFIFCLKGKAAAKALGAVVLVIAIRGVVLSDSRGAQLACIAGVCATLYFLGSSKMSRRTAIIAGLLGLVLAVGASARLGSVMEYKEDRSAMGRIEAWDTVLNSFPSYPIFGRGYDKFRSWMPAALDTHSSYMRALAELGGPGLFCYLGLLFFAFRKGYRLTRADIAPSPGVRFLAIGLLGALSVHCVASLFLTRLYYPFVLVQIGLISSLWIIADKERRRAQSRDFSQDGGAEEERNLWVASQNMGFATSKMVSGMDLLKILSIWIVCIVSYKVMVLISV